MKSKIGMSLKNKTLLITAAVVVVFVIVLIMVLNALAVNVFTASKREEVRSILEGQASKLEFALSRPLREVESLAKHERVVEYVNSEEQKDGDDKVLDLFNSFLVGSGYSNVYLMDETGIVTLSADPSFLDNNFAFRDYFKKAQSGKSHMQIAFGVLTHKPGYYFSAPVMVDGKVKAVVVIKVEVSYIDDLFAGSLTKTIGHYLLTDENGVVVSTDKEIEPYQSMGKIDEQKIKEIKEERRFEGFGVKPLQYQIAQDVIENYQGPVSMDYLDIEDGEEEEAEKELVQVQKIGSYPFYLVTESSLDSIFGQISDIVWPIMALLMGAVIIGLSLLSYIYKRNFAPLSKLEEYTKAIAEGKYGEMAKLHTGDEIESLSHSLATMVETLQAAKMQLEQKVEVKTDELSSSMRALEVKNLQMSKNEIAMLNILEDSKELEKQLEIEKKGVEAKVEERTKQLRDEQAKLMASISALPRAFLILSPDGSILTQNGRIESIFGHHDKAWSIEKINELLGEQIDLKAKLKEVFEEEQTFDIADLMYGAKYLRIYMAPVLNEAGDLLGAVMTIKDESEAKALARSRDEFFSIASHELRTPLTAIRGNTSMIMEYHKEILKDNDVKEMIEDTHEASIRLIGIVNDFLDMSRLEQGRMEYKKEMVDLRKVSDKVVSEFSANVIQKGVELRVEGEDKLEVNTDGNKFEQIIINLIGNSIKFTKSGYIKVKLEKKSDQVYITIEDTGEGIPLKNQNLLFHKFQQAGNSIMTRDGAKGTGLGLYISRLMAEGMGGKLELVSSEPGKGSIFGFSLPIK